MYVSFVNAYISHIVVHLTLPLERTDIGHFNCFKAQADQSGMVASHAPPAWVCARRDGRRHEEPLALAARLGVRAGEVRLQAGESRAQAQARAPT